MLFGALAVVGLVAAVGIVVSLVLGNAPEDHAVDLVPANAAFYATAYLDPSLGQKRATAEILDRARDAGAGEGTAESLEDAIGAFMTQSTEVDYERDVKPYAGAQMAIYARAEEDAAVLIATEDPGASQRAMHGMLEREFSSDYFRIVRDSHRGQPYEHAVYSDIDGSPSGAAAFTVLDGFVVVGSEEDVKASIDASSGASLAGSDRFAKARGSLDDDVLAFAYFDPEPLEEVARTDPYADSDEIEVLETVADLGPVVATLAAQDSRVELDMAMRAASGSPAPLQNPSALLKTLPAEAIAAISFGDLQGPLRTALADGSSDRASELREGFDELGELDADSDVASWLGLLGAYVAGDDTDVVEGAIVAETRSRGDSDWALDKLEDYYSSSYEYSYENSVYGSEDGLGFDVFSGDDMVQVRGDEDRVVIGGGAGGLSTDRALDADGGFGESETYLQAASLLGGYEPFLAIDAPSLQNLLEETSEARYDDTYMNGAREWLSTISTVAGGVRADGESLRIRLVAGID